MSWANSRNQEPWVDPNPRNTFNPLWAEPGAINRDEAAAAILAHSFVVAKSMPAFPHEYIVRKDWTGVIPWENLVQFMRDDSVGGVFRPRPGAKATHLLYWRYGGKRYWTMGNSLAVTRIINRDDDVPVPYLTLESQ